MTDQPHADTVSDVLDSDYVSITSDAFVDEAIDQFLAFDPDEDEETTIYYLYVVDDDGRLTGVASFRELVNEPEDALVESVVETDLITLAADEDVEQAAKRMSELDYQALPVVNEDGTLLGIVRSDDMLDVVEEEASEDIFKSAGFSFADVESARSETILESSISKIIGLRLPWLILALAGGLLAGLVIEGFEEDLEAVVALAFFIPVIMDMGGNVGTQASTIFVRGLATGHIDDRNAMRHFTREGVIGTIIGLIIGTLGAAAAYGWQGLLRENPDAPTISIVVFVALVAVCLVASTVGYIIPWLTHKAGLDPAAASDPLITTVKDVTALLIYFGLASLLLAEVL